MDSMVEGTSEESDGLDDTEFLEEHEKYLEYCENREAETLKQEEERQNVPRNPTWLWKCANVIFSKFEMW